MTVYLFFYDEGFYPVEEESDERVIRHVALNPGILRIETVEGRVVWEETKQ